MTSSHAEGPVDNTFYIENGNNCFDRVLIDGNCANQTDQLVLGNQPDAGADGPVPYVWSPLFTYHGFRYMQLEMTASDAASIPGGIESIQVKLHHVHTMVESAGGVKFNESTAAGGTLNKIQRSYLQTQLNNLHSIPTDCPTREKRGWMADAASVSDNAVAHFLPRICYRTLLGCLHRPLPKGQKDGDEANPSVTSRCGSLLLSLSALC